MPIDEEELDRIDLKHRLYTMLLGEKLFLAPIQPNPQRILDLGTGSGIWAIDMADAYTSAEVLGVDLAPIQPQWVPSNCRFEIDDVEEPWTYGRTFDFIHARDFLFSILDWQNLVNSCYENTTPGGYTELQCLLPEAHCDDDSTPADQGVREFSEKVCDASEIAGWSLREPKNYKKYMENAGFEDVTEVRYKIPTSSWPKDKRTKMLGALEMQSLLQGASAFSLRAFSRAYGWTQTQTEMFLLKMRHDVRDLRYHTYYQFIVCYGRKPGSLIPGASDSAVSLGHHGE
ncbi:Secondary metabolism regulator [Lachnellula occidentalis]|uniref:Secondary metabolism regulator n=1 Tax=Lachnellula occidentalis TaxID=215460 RepID=A0A8H8S225_9HELO|nr:Secondary metabolism regulator [Lachnellula occidentalis]